MNKMLTIDWDFFIDVSLSDRTDTFPHITDGSLSYNPDNSLWDKVSCNTRLFNKDFNQLVSCISSMKGLFKNTFVSENHGEAYNVFNLCGGFDEIVNVDFHHDLYFGSSHLCCDNWCTLLKNKNQFKYFWVKRKDSVTTTFGEEVDANILSFSKLLCLIKSGCFNTIHLCRSDLYTPPKFDPYFDLLKNTIINKSLSFKVLGHPLQMR